MSVGTITVAVTLAILGLALSYPAIKDEERIVLRAGPGDLNAGSAEETLESEGKEMEEVSGVSGSLGQTGDSIPKHPLPEKNETWVKLSSKGHTTKLEFSSSAAVSNSDAKDGLVFSSSRAHSTGGFIFTHRDAVKKPHPTQHLKEEENGKAEERKQLPHSPKNTEEENQKPIEERLHPSPNKIESYEGKPEAVTVEENELHTKQREILKLFRG